MATLHPYSGDPTKRIINQSLGSRDWHQRHLIPPRSIHSLALTYLVLQICKYIFHLMSSRLKFCAWALHSVFVKNLTVKVALWTKVNLCHILLQWSGKIPEDKYSRQKLYANIIQMSQCKSTSLKGIHPCDEQNLYICTNIIEIYSKCFTKIRQIFQWKILSVEGDDPCDRQKAVSHPVTHCWPAEGEKVNVLDKLLSSLWMYFFMVSHVSLFWTYPTHPRTDLISFFSGIIQGVFDCPQPSCIGWYILHLWTVKYSASNLYNESSILV